MGDERLSHKWGITGPKRKAVIARLGKLSLILEWMIVRERIKVGMRVRVVNGIWY
jgi:hypothetical protein